MLVEASSLKGAFSLSLLEILAMLLAVNKLTQLKNIYLNNFKTQIKIPQRIFVLIDEFHFVFLFVVEVLARNNKVRFDSALRTSTFVLFVKTRIAPRANAFNAVDVEAIFKNAKSTAFSRFLVHDHIKTNSTSKILASLIRK